MRRNVARLKSARTGLDSKTNANSVSYELSRQIKIFGSAGLDALPSETRIWQPTKLSGRFCRFSAAQTRARVSTIRSYRPPSHLYPATGRVPAADRRSSIG